jgi:hypothetical protein
LYEYSIANGTLVRDFGKIMVIGNRIIPFKPYDETLFVCSVSGGMKEFDIKTGSVKRMSFGNNKDGSKKEKIAQEGVSASISV